MKLEIITLENQYFLDFSVNIQIHVLRRVKDIYHNDVWTDEFDKLVDETSSKIALDIENYILHPEHPFKPLSRNFNEHDKDVRKEITTEVINRFISFKQDER